MYLEQPDFEASSELDTNRMNIYVVRKATQGLANYIIKAGKQDKGVAIAYDSRRIVT